MDFIAQMPYIIRRTRTIPRGNVPVTSVGKLHSVRANVEWRRRRGSATHNHCAQHRIFFLGAIPCSSGGQGIREGPYPSNRRTSCVLRSIIAISFSGISERDKDPWLWRARHTVDCLCLMPKRSCLSRAGPAATRDLRDKIRDW